MYLVILHSTPMYTTSKMCILEIVKTQNPVIYIFE